mgnify:CR=1 FL=1
MLQRKFDCRLFLIILFWFGLSGGFWTPFVIGSGWFYQPWVRLLPYCIGGVVDFGPIIGMRVHRYASVFFRSTLWCPLPPGILNYDESNNTFSIDYKFLDMFYQHCMLHHQNEYHQEQSCFSFFLQTN